MITINKLENNIDHVIFNGLEKFNVINVENIRIELTKLFETPNARVILDLSSINYIDSSGFGCFLIIMKTARNNYGVLKFCSINPKVQSVFETLQLHTVFDIYDDLESCITSFIRD